MNPNRTARIASIIEQRRPLAQKIEVVEGNLRSLASTLRHLEEHRNQLLVRVDDPNTSGHLQEIDCSTIQRSIEAELLAFSQLRVRFSRDTLNIGVIGRARQGKSRLLQSLTGLTAAEIPDGDRQHCTGVRSTIHHNANVETYGEVWFHSERSFLDEVIAPYYEKLRLGSKPITLEAFARNPLPQLPDGIPGYAEPGAMHQHLKRYHDNLDNYRHLLVSSSPRRITKEEIREYVAQDTPDGKRVFFNYLAVKEVKITCKFPNEAVGQIALVDMPGLGDTGIGDEDRLVKTLGQEVDAVLFIRMPKSSGDYWADVDVRLYDIAHDALVDLPINLWSFLILNRTDVNSKNGDNWNNCKDLVESISEKHINVVEYVIANCANTQEANGVIDWILNYMTNNIVALDRKYASSCQERLVRLQSTVAAELDKAHQALNQATRRDNWFTSFVQLFDQLWNDLTSGLEELLKELREQRDAQDMDFKQQVDAALQACRDDTGIPSEEQIKARRDGVGGYPIAYYQYLCDYPGGYHEAKASPEEKKFIKELLRESVAVIIAIDAPALMEDKKGILHEKINRPQQIKNLFNAAYQDIDSPRLVILAPIKCEKYLKNEETAKELSEQVRKGYDNLFNHFNSEKLNPWIVSVITPVQTVGSVVFSRIEFDTQSNPHFFFRKVRHDAKYSPKDSEQPLRYLLRFLLKLHLDSRSWGLFNFLRDWLGIDTYLKKAVDEFARGCKTNGGFAVLKGEKWLNI